MIHCKGLFAGRYRMVATNAKTGKQRLLADWFPNLITDFGLNMKGAMSGTGIGNSVMSSFHVGSGTNTPLVSDTALQSPVATSTDQQSLVIGAAQDPPYFAWYRRTVRFDEGVAAGNLSEVGVGSNSGATLSSLFSRALILDGNGDPTTITVLSNEYLDVTYELRLYAPTSDFTATIADGADSYNVIVRPASVTTSDTAGLASSDSNWSPSNLVGRVEFSAAPSVASAYTGDIGSVTQIPSGSVIGSGGSERFWGSVTNDPYSNNSLERTATYFAGLNRFNGSIRSLRFFVNGLGRTWQAQFDPPIPKDNTKVLRVGMKVSWGRHDP